MRTLRLLALLALAAGFAQAQTPHIDSLSPSHAAACSSDLQLNVYGSNFSGTPGYSSTVYWTTNVPQAVPTALSATFVNSTQMRATVPASLLTTPGERRVYVSQPLGGTSNQVIFTIDTPSPIIISSLSPSSADVYSSSFTLAVTGSGFLPGMTVRWGQYTLDTTFVSSTRLNALVTSSRLTTAGDFNITVGSSCTTSNALTFTVNGFRITSLSPNPVTACGADFTLTVTGVGFRSDYYYPIVVYWNSTALTTTFRSTTQVTATVHGTLLASPGSASITVRQQGQTSNALPLTINSAPVAISSLSPSSALLGSPGFTLTVTGSGFTQSSRVRWEGADLTTTYQNSTTLLATVPASRLASAGSFNITVGSPCGTSPPVAFTVIGFVITSVQPGSASWCGTDLPITVAGSGFLPGSQVRWNSQSLSTTYVSASSLTATIPASLLRTTGEASISVMNPGPVSSNHLPFSVVGSPPSITSLSPTAATAGAALFTLTVNGSNFTSNMTIRWGGVPLPTTFRGATQLTATVSASLVASSGSAAITVGHDCGQSSGLTFTINPRPLTLTSLSPASAPGCGSAFTFTVIGSGFELGAVVRWNGSALSTSFVSDTQLTATVASGALSAPGPATITVQNPGGQPSGALTFTVTASTPTIGSLSPANIIAGSSTFTLTITGSGFTPSMFVSWRGTDLLTQFRSSSELVATVPADLIKEKGTFLVSVASPCGDSRTLEFTVLPPAAATVTAVDPNSAPSCSPDLPITVTGSGFVNGAELRWNATPLATRFVSATQLTATLPATLLSSAGLARISAQLPGSQSTNSVDFTVSAASPAITTLSPASAAPGSPAFTLTVHGTGFTPSMTVRWAGANLPTTFVNSHELTAAVSAIPAISPTSIEVLVVNACGALSNAVSFPVTTALTISSLSPAIVTTGSAAFTLTVSGAGFVANSVVHWNATPLATTFRGATQLTAAVPASLLATAATAQITVALPGGQTSNSLAFTVTILPAITSLSPDSADAGSAAITLTVNGTGFLAGSSVRWGSSTLSTTFLSSTRLTATLTPALLAAPGPFYVTVVLPGGIVTNGLNFTVNLPALPAMTLTGLPPSCSTAQQHQAQISLASPYPLPLIGEFVLSFTPAAGLPAAPDFPQNYRQVQFASGGTRAPFNLPSGGPRIELPMLQTGTVAGTITASLTGLTCASLPVTPPSGVTHTIEVLPAAPKINSLTITRTTAGFDVRIVGDSSIREVTEMLITFQAGATGNLQTTSLTVPLNSTFTTYYNGSASSPYGSTYQLTVPFIIDGQQTAVTSATVVLRNRIGSSQTVSASF